MVYLQKEIIKEIEILQDMVDKYKDELDAKFLFVCIDTRYQQIQDTYFKLFDLGQLPINAHFSNLYEQNLNELRNSIESNCETFLCYYKHYYLDRISRLKDYIIINIDKSYSYNNYINSDIYNNTLSLTKKETPLFDKDPNLGIFFLSYVTHMNKIFSKISKLDKIFSDINKSIQKSLIWSTSHINSEEELLQYAECICDIIKKSNNLQEEK